MEFRKRATFPTTEKNYECFSNYSNKGLSPKPNITKKGFLIDLMKEKVRQNSLDSRPKENLFNNWYGKDAITTNIFESKADEKTIQYENKTILQSDFTKLPTIGNENYHKPRNSNFSFGSNSKSNLKLDITAKT